MQQDTLIETEDLRGDALLDAYRHNTTFRARRAVELGIKEAGDRADIYLDVANKIVDRRTLPGAARDPGLVAAVVNAMAVERLGKALCESIADAGNAQAEGLATIAENLLPLAPDHDK